MNIAHLVDTFPKISETFILNQIYGVIKKGGNVHVFSKNRPEVTPEHEIVDECDLLDKVTYVDGPESYFEGVQVLSTEIPYLLAKGFGIEAVLSELRHGRSAPRHLVRTRSLYENGEDFDVLHAHFGTVANSFLFAQQHMSAPLVVSFYGYDASRIPRSNPSVYEELFNEAAAITYLSENMRDDLVEVGCPPNKARKIPLCIDTAKFRYRERKPAPREPIRLLTVARLVEKKGIKYGIKAVAELDLDRRIRYSIAGDGKKRSELERLINEIDAGDRVDLLGWQSHEQISELMDESHLFLLPSVTARDGDKEGTPTVLLEAQAAGLPVVSTVHAGIPEIVVDGDSGILVPERNVQSLVDALDRLIREPDRWPEMGRKGRNYIQQKHSIDAVAEELLDVYQSIVARTME
jgi:colanic acid/amylovoran biosynthesis glycosyltransferase